MVSRTLFVAPLLAALRTSDASPSTTEIAPGVYMPLLNCGAIERQNWVQGGGRGLDTAFAYGPIDQANVAEVIAKSGVPRSELFVTTKIPCCPSSGYSAAQCAQKNITSFNNTANIQSAVDALGVDYVDLLLLHWPCETVEHTVDAYRSMEAALRAGKARAIGVSDHNATMIEAIMEATTVKPAVLQISMSVGGHFPTEMEWGMDDVTFARAKELGITTAAWASLGGSLSINVLKDPTVLAVAAAHQRSAPQVALRWLVQRGVVAITATNSSAHVASDLAVLDFELTEQEMELLTAVPTPPFHGPPSASVASGLADVELVV